MNKKKELFYKNYFLGKPNVFSEPFALKILKQILKVVPLNFLNLNWSSSSPSFGGQTLVSDVQTGGWLWKDVEGWEAMLSDWSTVGFTWNPRTPHSSQICQRRMVPQASYVQSVAWGQAGIHVELKKSHSHTQCTIWSQVYIQLKRRLMRI